MRAGEGLKHTGMIRVCVTYNKTKKLMTAQNKSTIPSTLSHDLFSRTLPAHSRVWSVCQLISHSHLPPDKYTIASLNLVVWNYLHHFVPLVD